MTDPIPSRTEPVNPLPEHFGRDHRPRNLGGAVCFGLVFLLRAGGETAPPLSLWWVGGVDQLINSSVEFILGYWGVLILGAILLPLASVKCFVHAKRLRSPSALEI